MVEEDLISRTQVQLGYISPITQVNQQADWR